MNLIRRKQTLIGVILTASLGLLVGCNTPTVTSQSAPPPVPVNVATVETKSIPVELRAIASVEPVAIVAVKSRLTGQVASVQFNEGQDVKKGDVLFTIDHKPFDVALRMAEANLGRDTALAENAKVTRRRFEQLFKEGVASREQFDQANAQSDALDATVRADQAALEKARIDVEYCNIVSPISGRTGSVMVHAGNLVEANKDPALVVIQQVQPIYVTFAVPEQNIQEIRARMAGSRLAVEVEVPDSTEREQGELTFVDSAVDRTTGTIRLKATFPNNARRLWPGQFVNSTLRLATHSSAIVVPAAAVQSGQNGTYVFIVKQDHTAEMRPVAAGVTWSGLTIIDKGVAAGETVVTDGQLRLVPGAKVEVKGSGGK